MEDRNTTLAPIPAQRKALVPAMPPDALKEAQEAQQAAHADNTKRTYRAAATKVVGWVHEHHPEVVRQDERDPLLAILPLHPATVCDFLVRVRKENGGIPSTGTLGVYLSAIRAMHKRLGFTPNPADDPALKDVWKGLRRQRGTRKHGKAPLRWSMLKRVVDGAAEQQEPWASRDRAILLVGFAGAFRRSELVSLRARDVALPTLPGEPLILTLNQGTKTRTDPIEVEIPARNDAYCPVVAFRAWVELLVERVPATFSLDSAVWWGLWSSGLLHGPLSGASVRLIVQRGARRAGLSEREVEALSAHSLRSGAATTAAEAGVEARKIKRLGRWESYQTVDKYIQDKRWGADHPLASLE